MALLDPAGAGVFFGVTAFRDFVVLAEPRRRAQYQSSRVGAFREPF